jgi:hypothetical protein
MPTKNNLAYRLQFHAPDEQPSPAATDRLTLFNTRRLAFFGTMVVECVACADLYPGDADEQAQYCLLQIQGLVGRGIGSA